MSELNWLDWIVIGLISLSVVVSLFRGLIREVMSLLVWGVALWIALRFSNVGADFLVGYIELPSARQAVAFGLFFLVTLLVGGIASYLIGQLVEKTGLSGTDRMMGALFGILRGVAVVLLLVLFAGFTPVTKDPWWQASVIMPHFERLAVWASSYLPEEVSQYIDYGDPDAPEQTQTIVSRMKGPGSN